MIPKRVNLQFQTLLMAAEKHSLCVVESSNRKTGKPSFLLCVQDNKNNYVPLAVFGALTEHHHPGHNCTKLI